MVYVFTEAVNHSTSTPKVVLSILSLVYTAREIREIEDKYI